MDSKIYMALSTVIQLHGIIFEFEKPENDDDNNNDTLQWFIKSPKGTWLRVTLTSTTIKGAPHNLFSLEAEDPEGDDELADIIHGAIAKTAGKENELDDSLDDLMGMGNVWLSTLLKMANYVVIQYNEDKKELGIAFKSVTYDVKGLLTVDVEGSVHLNTTSMPDKFEAFMTDIKSMLHIRQTSDYVKGDKHGELWSYDLAAIHADSVHDVQNLENTDDDDSEQS